MTLEPKPPVARPAPSAADHDEASGLGLAVMRRAVDRWRRLVADSKRSYELVDLAPAELVDQLEGWAGLERDEMNRAETALVRAILASSGDRSVAHSARPERRRWPNRGVVVDGVMYLAVVDPNRVGEKADDKVDMMRLVVVDRANLLDLDAR